MSTQSNLNNNEISENINIDNNIDIEKIVKKRGRKPKNKNIEENNDEKSDIKKIEEPKVLKKRGRKPKVKTEEEEIKIPKKRGRKPKEKIYSVKELPKTFYEENKNETLILHLPIDISSKEEKNIQPLPSDSIQNNYGLQESNIINENEFNLPTQMNLLENDQKEIEKNENQNEDKEKKIKEDKSNSKAWSNNINHSNKVLKKNLRNILYQFIDSNKEKVWPESTNICCWWCCHGFQNTPCSLPFSYKKNKFYVKGIFCSFNCSASYNFNMNDNNIHERYSLLNLMYKKLYYRKFIKINLAPPRESLKMFGGYLDIDEFRNYCLENERIFNLIDPPLISIIPKIEESVNQKNLNGGLGVQVNENILQKTQDSLKLKRSKPIYNPSNSLQSFMDLKII
jgi:hypothetical protein